MGSAEQGRIVAAKKRPGAKALVFEPGYRGRSELKPRATSPLLIRKSNAGGKSKAGGAELIGQKVNTGILRSAQDDNW
jgi:hypothetical protein